MSLNYGSSAEPTIFGKIFFNKLVFLSIMYCKEPRNLNLCRFIWYWAFLYNAKISDFHIDNWKRNNKLMHLSMVFVIQVSLKRCKQVVSVVKLWTLSVEVLPKLRGNSLFLPLSKTSTTDLFWGKVFNVWNELWDSESELSLAKW